MLRIRFVRRRALLCLAFVLFAAPSCDKKKDEGVVGSGIQATATRSVPPFARLSVGNGFEVKVTVGSDGPLELKGDDNLLSHVTARVEKGILSLDVDSKVKRKLPLEARISTRTLEGVSVAVVAKVEIQGLSVDRFEARAAGAGRIVASGSAEVLDLAGKGASLLDFTKVPAREASVRLEHASQAKLGYVEKLRATASGPSRIYHAGEPVIESALTKPAQIIRVER